MIRQCLPQDINRIYLVINEAAKAYDGTIPADCYHQPYMPVDELRREMERMTIFGWEVNGELAGIMQEKDWFKIDSKHQEASAKIDKSSRSCPRDGETLRTLEYGHETGIKIDVCPECEGLWLDAGEIQAIHKAEETWLEKIKELFEEELTAVELFLIKIGPYLPK